MKVVNQGTQLNFKAKVHVTTKVNFWVLCYFCFHFFEITEIRQMKEEEKNVVNYIMIRN